MKRSANERYFEDSIKNMEARVALTYKCRRDVKLDDCITENARLSHTVYDQTMINDV